MYNQLIKGNEPMNYILSNVGKLPSYLEQCLNTILSIDKNAEIYLISDQNVNIKNVHTLHINDFKDLLEIKKKLQHYYKDTGWSEDLYPLFYTSLFRIFLLEKASNELNIGKFIHFDNDVLIYLAYEDVVKSLDSNKINITQVNSKDFSFGYSYFPNKSLITDLAFRVNTLLSQSDIYSKSYSRGGPLNEMRILGIINKENFDYFNTLPSLPYWTKEDILFDPSSYGQYFNGMHHRRGNYFFKRRWVHHSEYVGGEIKSKRINVSMDKSQPIVSFDNKSYKLANLHVHSKKLIKFLPADYKKYISL
jgi:hypothetical protein